VWYFPANLPHSLVGLEPDGCQFVSGYKSPDFDERQAFSASSWLATLPVDTLAQVGGPGTGFGGCMLGCYTAAAGCIMFVQL
jgi:hypothetical protein